MSKKSLKYKKMFMKSAYLSAKMSFCKRAQVGSVITKDNRILVNSWNGTIKGKSNCCEEELNGTLATKSTVVHAEANALMFAAKMGIKTKGTVMFVTLSPCIECSKLIVQAGIKKVVYSKEYRDTSGIDFLKSTNVKVEKLS